MNTQTAVTLDDNSATETSPLLGIALQRPKTNTRHSMALFYLILSDFLAAVFLYFIYLSVNQDIFTSWPGWERVRRQALTADFDSLGFADFGSDPDRAFIWIHTGK